ncbi:hypothetical protein M8R19_25085 [Pseudomonas sp. R3.Fl]|uniref:hypothetical protein n=1 Tax=Pseudomonas TaxID=286 RepID=UPI00201E671F|nr:MULTISPECIES: hypothetical protein [Pseudomonas]MCL6691968.1 hypothetical protein [Pseudomonas sp. R3.Fl]MCP1644067.1 hypothetical protein [Pseudomonas citronellolis]MCP1667113.1 hypothetical protein [Pseudomonas citronellolis]MCP1697748.1 hypothetical protein [Pseudomonas citronellolis]MCP1704652.1 hypothetical protein [Pseudomonas citronellolis]
MSELPPLSPRPSRRELRKAVLRLRLEVQRQQLRQESEKLLQPLRQARDLGQGVRQQFSGGASLWAAGGAAAAAALMLRRKRGLVRLLRLAVVLAPLLLKLRKTADKPTKPTADQGG